MYSQALSPLPRSSMLLFAGLLRHSCHLTPPPCLLPRGGGGGKFPFRLLICARLRDLIALCATTPAAVGGEGKGCHRPAFLPSSFIS